MCVFVCFAAVLSVDSRPLEAQFYPFVPLRSQSWMQFLIRRWSAGGFVGLVFTGRLEFANKKKLVRDWTVLYCFLLWTSPYSRFKFMSACYGVCFYQNYHDRMHFRTEDTFYAFCGESNENHKALLPYDLLQKGLILFCQFSVYCWIYSMYCTLVIYAGDLCWQLQTTKSVFWPPSFKGLSWFIFMFVL
jgi:hypothetical protein